jgi:hypothetical protein
VLLLGVGTGDQSGAVGAEGASSTSRWKWICRWPPRVGADLLRGDVVDRTIKEEEERRTERMPDPRLEASTTGNI